MFCCKTSETVVSRSSSSLPQWPDYELTEKDGNLTLTRFAPIKKTIPNVPLPKGLNFGGGKPLKSGSSLKVQAQANYAGLCHFVHECEQGKALDGFCIEIDHPLAQSGTGIQEFGQCVRTMLTCLSEFGSMQRIYKCVSSILDHVDGDSDLDEWIFFVTTFCTLLLFYHIKSVCAFGTNRAFVLLQPEMSFFRHVSYLQIHPKRIGINPKQYVTRHV